MKILRNRQFTQSAALSIFLFVLVLGIATIILPKSARAVADCDVVTKPYNCPMSNRLFEKEINSWCANTTPGKVNPDDDNSPTFNEVCKLTFWTFVHRGGSSFTGLAGFTNPDYCTNIPADKKDLAKDFCYVIPKPNSSYYRFYKKVIDDCGVGDSRDAQCVIDIKKEFLRSQRPPWALPETPTDGGKNVDVNRYEPNNSPFIIRVTTYMRWLLLGVGLLAIFGFVLAGIQYAAAQDNSQSLAAAKSRMSNIIIGILIYVFMFAILQWLIPGGLF